MRLDSVISTGSLLSLNLARDPESQTVAVIAKASVMRPSVFTWAYAGRRLGGEILDTFLKVRDLQVGRLWWLGG